MESHTIPATEPFPFTNFKVVGNYCIEVEIEVVAEDLHQTVAVWVFNFNFNTLIPNNFKVGEWEWLGGRYCVRLHYHGQLDTDNIDFYHQ